MDPRGGGTFLGKMYFCKNSRVGVQIWPPFVPTRLGPKMFFGCVLTPRGVLGGSGGAEPPRKSIRCPPYFTNPWASLKRHTAIYIYIYIYMEMDHLSQ